MKSSRLSRFFYLMLIVALLVVSVAWMKDLFVTVVFCAFELNGYLMPLLMKRDTRRLGWVLWVCACCALAGAHYFADLLLVPSNHTLFHSREVIVLSIVSMVGGLAVTYYAPPGRAKAVQQGPA